MMRLFVGLEIAETIKSELKQISFGLPDARWVAPENLHLTLRFIGDVDEGIAEDIDSVLAGISSPVFNLSIQGVDCFKSRNKVRAVWAGVPFEPGLTRLQGKVTQALIHAGLEAEHRKFKPHITLARLKQAPIASVTGFLESHADLYLSPFPVDHFTLFRSHLGQAGAAYEVLSRYQLISPAIF